MKANGKNIIVTGAAAGIGRELAIQLVEKGATVIALDISEEGLNETKRLIGNDEKISTHVVNMGSREELENFKKEYFEKYDVIDGIINNAGIIQPFTNVENLKVETVDKVMDVNFYGPLFLIQHFLKEMKEREEAHIVNVASMGGFFPFPGQTVYGASKAALKLLTEGLYSELLHTNVKVTLTLPGAIKTDIAKNSGAEFKSSADSSKMKMLEAKEAARLIIDAMEKNKFKSYVGSDSKMMNLMYKFNDKKAIQYVNKMMAKMS